MKLKYQFLVGCTIAINLLTTAVQSRWYDPATVQQGHSLFQQHCATCHKANAEGTPQWKQRDPQGNFPPPPLNGTAHAWHHSKSLLAKTIREGGIKLGGTMPAFKDILSTSEIDAVIAYFQSKWPDDLYVKWESHFQGKQSGISQDSKVNPAKNKITRLLKLRLGSDKVTEPVETPVNGIYLTQFGSKYAYITRDGRFVLVGDLIDLELGQNLTKLARSNKQPPAQRAFIPTIKESLEKPDMTALFKASLGSTNVSRPVKSPVNDIYQTQFGFNFAYLTKDGRYVFMADLVDLKRGLNLTTLAKREVSKTNLKTFRNTDKALFPAIGPQKAVVDIFTDTSCASCKKLFKEVPELQKAGISVRYLPFPDDGLTGAGYQTLKQVWCSSDKAKSLTIGKGFKPGHLPDGNCQDASLVDKSYALGQSIGVIGTPAIFKSNGEQIKGYVSSEKLIPLILTGD